MAVKALKASASEKYSLIGDPARGTDDATVFHLSGLSSRVVGFIKDGTVRYRQDPENADQMVADVNANKAAWDVVRFGLKGFDNYVDEDGKPVEFESEPAVIWGIPCVAVKGTLMDRIDSDIIMELAGRIRALSTTTAEERKN